MKKFRVLLLLAAVILEVGCGLPDTFFLQPPTSLTQASLGSNLFRFSNPVHDINHDINVNFTGDELYYKLYSDPSQITGNDYTSSNPADPSAQLTAKGFFPVCLLSDPVGSRTDPPIAIDAATAAAGSTVTVTINSDVLSSFVLNSNSAVEIRRNATNIPFPTTYKTFQNVANGGSLGNGYATGDQDLAFPSTSFSGLVYLAWYVVSFGYTNTSTPSRSSAVFMGYMGIPGP